jgi:hypothetical protein
MAMVISLLCPGFLFMLGERHGLSKHPLHKIWHGIKCRCNTPTTNGYHRYGGAGVKMSEEWENGFKSFYNWCIANGWKKGLQIDKDLKAKELNLPANLYSAERCSIVTPKQNNNSRKSNRLLEFSGEKLTISQWADKTGIPRNAIRMRIEVHGYSISEALTIPKHKQLHPADCFKIEYEGVTMPASYWAKELNATQKDIMRSLKNGKPFDAIYKRYKSGKKRKDAKNVINIANSGKPNGTKKNNR